MTAKRSTPLSQPDSTHISETSQRDFEIETVRARFTELLDNLESPRILEAGCGSLSHLPFPANTHVTGIDISRQQLERNTLAHEKIHADVQTHRFPDESFDAIVCWDVLEHLPKPNRALDGFVPALKSGGVLLLALPHVRSLKGWITKLTPHWFHVWVYRALLGDKQAGKHDRAPFRTYHRSSITPGALLRWGEQANLNIEMLATYESDFVSWIEHRHVLLRTGWRLLRSMIRIVTLGRMETRHTDMIALFRKQ